MQVHAPLISIYVRTYIKQQVVDVPVSDKFSTEALNLNCLCSLWKFTLELQLLICMYM